MNPEAEDVGKRLSQPFLGLSAGKCAPARRILLMAVEVWEILSPLRVGGGGFVISAYFSDLVLSNDLSRSFPCKWEI